MDEVTIEASSGKGGDGCSAFLREKFRPKGGPSGGDGGKGGDLVFLANPQMATLLDYRFVPLHHARNGEPGRGKNQHGAFAEDHVIAVPVGTLIKDAETGVVLHDMCKPNERWVALKGGQGGRGNSRFATSTCQAPRYHEPGEPGQEARFALELKLLADVGLIGYPNAGKSTLISAISAARPKIADYPFTTLVPNLGVVKAGADSFVVADIPGLIEGAHEGAGLGHRFLRHVERTALFVHVVDLAIFEGDPVERFDAVEAELTAYSDELTDRPRIVALNKLDVTEATERFEEVAARLRARGHEVYGISAATRLGVTVLVRAIASRLREQHKREHNLAHAS